MAMNFDTNLEGIEQFTLFPLIDRPTQHHILLLIGQELNVVVVGWWVVVLINYQPSLGSLITIKLTFDLANENTKVDIIPLVGQSQLI